jgi:hypothetical protein
MGLFDFPRINFRGTITLNPGTANNDDYAQQPGALTLPASWGTFAGQPFGLIDSKQVKARTYGMSDEAFIAWVQQQQTFDVSGSPGQTSTRFPAEWNYYGDMSSSAKTTVIGVQTAPGKLYTASDPSVPLSAIIGAPLTFTGGITDVNSEGSPPATQFFIDVLQLMSGGKAAVKGQPSKGACQWINFYRNVSRQGDAGAGGYIYHVLLAGSGTTINVPGISPKVRGLVLRYYLFNIQQGAGGQALAELYKQKKANPATLQIVGTLAPLADDEHILTGPVGRLLIMNAANIKTPDGSKNNSPNGLVSLAPAVLRRSGNTVSADFSGTFPDNGQGNPTPKFDFGPVSLMVTGGGKTATLGPVPYTDVNGGDQRGWLFDFDIASNADAQKALQDPEATFSLSNPTYQTVLAETDYYFPSNQQAIYAEQHGAGGLFRNEGPLEPATVSVYRRGKRLSAADCPPITVWQYRSTPIQSPGNATVLSANFKPGQPLTIDTSHPGNVLLTFTINDAANPAPGGYPPQNYATYSFPPYVTNMSAISVRILPNGEDFSRYYVDPAEDEPVGNALLTFDVLYAKVLRTYYLLFPAMNKVIPLNSEPAVAAAAQAILDRTELSLWMTTAYMPRTRDMSRSRRTLLRAWCRKVLMG